MINWLLLLGGLYLLGLIIKAVSRAAMSRELREEWDGRAAEGAELVKLIESNKSRQQIRAALGEEEGT